MSIKKKINSLTKYVGDLFGKFFLSRIWDKPVIIGLILVLFSIPFHFGTLTLFNLETNDRDVIQNFIEWFGVPYGLLIALILVNVWNQFDTVEREFDREVDAFSMLLETVLIIRNDNNDLTKCKSQIVQKIAKYVSHVIANYIQETKDKKVRKKGDKFLNEIREIVREVIHGGENETVCAELLHQLHEAVDVRGDRIVHASQRMPGTLRVLALISSVLWIVPFFMLDFKNIWLGYFLLAGVTFVVVGLLAVIWDLDDPFGGTWKIKVESWEELHKHLQSLNRENRKHSGE